MSIKSVLDLVHIPVAPVEGRALQALDLAGIEKYSTESLAQGKLFSPEKPLPSRAIKVYGPDLYVPSPKYRPFAPLRTYQGSCASLKLQIQGTVNEQLDALDYNGLTPVVQLIDHLEKHGQQKPCLALQSFEISSRDEDVATRAGTCVSLSWSLVKTMKERFNVDGEVVSQRHGNGPVEHMAAIFPCEDGWLLIEPSWSPEERFLIIPYNAPLVTPEMTISSQRRPGEQSKITTPTLKIQLNDVAMEYLQTVKKADTLVLTKFMLRRDIFPITAYKNGRNHKAILVFPDISKVTLQDYPGGEKRKVLSTTFAAINQDREKFAQQLADFMGDDFRSAPLIPGQIMKIASSAGVLRTLYDQVRIPKLF